LFLGSMPSSLFFYGYNDSIARACEKTGSLKNI
jgi:hypothetical protein